MATHDFGPVARFDKKFLDPDKVDGYQFVHELSQAVNLRIYGPEALLYIQEAMTSKEDPAIVTQAVRFFIQALIRSEMLYRTSRPELFRDNREFDAAMKTHHINVARGNIGLVPDAFAFTPEEGRGQVQCADAALSTVDRRVQQWLASVNENRFTASTMLTGAELLRNFQNGQASTLLGWTERSLSQKAMPHLTLSNLAIGQIAGHVAKYAQQPVRMFDMGAGMGATSGAICLEVRDALRDQARMLPPPSVTAIESNQKFFRELRGPFWDALRQIQQTSPSTPLLEMVNSDLTEGLTKLHPNTLPMPGILGVFAANYVWHRLTTPMKAAIIKDMSDLYPNCIFLIADLVQNASRVNTHYFNLRDNGILNCGNIGLAGLFEKCGMTVQQLNADTAPSSMHPELATRIGAGTTSDSIFLMAYKGEAAERALYAI